MKILFTEITAALAETIIIYIYLNFFFPSDRSNKYQVKNLFYYGGFFILNFVFSIFIESPPLRMILLTVLMIILTVFVQKASLLPACCAAVIFSVLLVLFEFIGAIVLLSAGGESPRISLESPVLTIFTKLTEMTCISIIISFSKRNPFHLSFRSMLPLIAGNIFSLFICIQLWY